MLEYTATLEWMFSQLPMYQRIGAPAFKKDLTNSLLFAEKLENPHHYFKSIHVAGTNGKGSTSHMLASILQEAGYEVGLYTSPHLKDYRERIKVNGKEIPEDEVVRFISNHKDFLEKQQLSFFEMSVGLAFDFFKKEKVDIAIIEVGLGGRLDSTNIITPILSIITNIGFDHTQMLGNSLTEIAGEKAGIIKNEVPVIIGENQEETRPVFENVASSRKASIIFAEDSERENLSSDLTGFYQIKNIHTVATAVKKLCSMGWNIPRHNLEQGFLTVRENTGLKGRWEVLKHAPKVICDTAHNAEGLNYVIKQLLEESFRALHIVLGVVNDKDLEKVLPIFPKNANYYFCQPAVPRGMDAQFLKEQANIFGLIGEVYSSVSKAYEQALKEASIEDVIFIGGSTFTVAEII